MKVALSYLLDTTVFSQPIKDHPLDPVLERWSRIGDAAVCTSAICLAELLQGLEARGSAKYWRRYREILEVKYTVLPSDTSAASAYGELYGELRRRGEPKPTVDLMIAASAKCHGLIIATLNSRDFHGIPGIAVEDWNPT